jgi:drug/metabolite transporter (DMT)-like permease
LVAARVASVLLVGAATVVGRHGLRVPRRVLPAVLLAGIGDVTANALYLVATQHGPLAITGVLASLYPASTVVLAQLVLRERLVRTQAAGLAAATAAVVLIALPA